MARRDLIFVFLSFSRSFLLALNAELCFLLLEGFRCVRVGLQHILHLPKQRSQKCKKKPVNALKPEVEQAFFLILLMLVFCPLSDELFLEATEASLFSLATHLVKMELGK